jgi:hypothetical protein
VKTRFWPLSSKANDSPQNLGDKVSGGIFRSIATGGVADRQVFLIRTPEERAGMQLSYDPRRNIAYIRLREPAGSQVETIQLSNELSIDLAPDGTV